MKIIDLRQIPQSLNQLAQWHHREWAHFNPGQSLQQRIEKMQSYLNDDFIPSTFVAIEDDEVLGSAAIIESDMEDRSELTPWLASVFVGPDKRKQGIGSQLVKHVMTQAASKRYRNLYLYTENDTGFYQRLGWEPLEARNYYGTDVIIMCCHLKDGI